MTDKKKEKLGKKFFSDFLDVRDPDPNSVADKVGSWLRTNKVDYEELKDDNHFNLIKSFFKDYRVLHINHLHEHNSKTILVGKGVTYDSGGYDIKGSMADMFHDKAGAILTIASAIANNAPALVFFVNNLVSEKAVLPGSILKENITGLNVYIADTDAEGRIGLSNLIAYADKQLGYQSIITVATLTGHAPYVTGEKTYCMAHSTDTDVLKSILSATIDEGVKWWPAPFHKDYDKAVDSRVVGADITNLPSYKGAGTSTAFSFLKRFIDKKKTLHHLDVAGMMYDGDGNGVMFGMKEVKKLLTISNIY